MRVAAIILSYRMPEMTDALVARFKEVIRYPHDLFVIDNGSPEFEAAVSTTHRCKPNRRLTGGFNFGIECARDKEAWDNRADIQGAKIGGYDAFWFICNDIRFQGSTDVLAACMARVEKDPTIGIIHPSLSKGPGIWNWPHMYGRHHGVHEAWFVDIVCPIYTRRTMGILGWQFDPALVHGWGVDLYTCYEAWRNDLRVVVCSDAEVWHKMGTTYNAGKDPEFRDFDAYKAAAGGGQGAVLSAKYGAEYMKTFQAAPAEYHRRNG